MSKPVAVLAKKRSTRKVLVGAATIGIDLGDQWSHYCMLDESGEVTEEGRFRTTEGGVTKRFVDMEPVRIAMEAGAHSIWISEQLKEYGHEVIVANVTELHAISRNDRKSDRTDVAHAIAVLAASEQAAARIYNICDEPNQSELAWQSAIAKQMNWHGRFVVLPREQTPKHLLQPGNAAQHVVVSSERIRTELDYKELVGIEEAMRRTIAWEEQNPPSTISAQQFDYAAEDAALAGAP